MHFSAHTVTLTCVLLHDMSCSCGGMEVNGESKSKDGTAEGDEVVVSALAVGLTGWISHNPEEN